MLSKHKSNKCITYNIIFDCGIEASHLFPLTVTCSYVSTAQTETSSATHWSRSQARALSRPIDRLSKKAPQRRPLTMRCLHKCCHLIFCPSLVPARPLRSNTLRHNTWDFLGSPDTGAYITVKSCKMSSWTNSAGTRSWRSEAQRRQDATKSLRII